MDKLYNYIVGKYDSSLIKKTYGISLRDFLEHGVDERYIDDISILKMFHDIYLDIKEKFVGFDFEDIKKVSDKYLFLISRMKEYKENGNYNRSNFIINHKPFVDINCINYVKNISSMFSLNELFGNFSVNWFCGVCLISKIQTVCMYNDDSFGYIGSGYHNDSFHKIIRAIYDEKFTDDSGLKFNDTGQDIKVSFSNGFGSFKNGPSFGVKVFVDVPVPINSSQLQSLKILNDEIKKYKGHNDVKIEVSASIVNLNDQDFFLEFDDCESLDEVFKWCIVSDSYKPIYEDKNMVGFKNGENHFNDKKNVKQK